MATSGAAGSSIVARRQLRSEFSASSRLGLTLPLAGRVARRSAAKAGGVGVVVVARRAWPTLTPTPHPSPPGGGERDGGAGGGAHRGGAARAGGVGVILVARRGCPALPPPPHPSPQGGGERTESA